MLCAQTLGLVTDDMDPHTVALFLRNCPALSKQTIGELLGEPDDFFLKVLDEFTASFDFQGAVCRCMQQSTCIEHTLLHI